ncbi:MAG TPA: GIY-YIG nuclease family protein [Gammaproteobacteria bacterium]|jgi:putative endonuclease
MTTDSWFVYIVRCADNTLYTGVARDVEKRLQQHNHGNAGAKYTRSRRPVELVYRECAANRSVAQQREYRIRRLSTAQKRQLIESGTGLT